MNTGARLVSLLLPTRGRVEKLEESLRSLEETVSCAADVEVLIRADEDDIATVQHLAISRYKFHVGVFVGPRHNGYADLHTYYNELCEFANGRFLFLWNDDATMVTEGWDLQLATHDVDKLCYVKSRIRDGRGRDRWLFPIVHRSYYELLGHFSLSAHNDTYVYSVFSNFPATFCDTDITIHHHALENLKQKDTTTLEAKQWWSTTKALWDSEEVQNGLRADVQKVHELLKQQSALRIG